MNLLRSSDRIELALSRGFEALQMMVSVDMVCVFRSNKAPVQSLCAQNSWLTIFVPGHLQEHFDTRRFDPGLLS